MQQGRVPTLLLVYSVGKRVETLVDATHVVLSEALDAASQPVEHIPASRRQHIPHALPPIFYRVTRHPGYRFRRGDYRASDRWADAGVRQWVLIAVLPRVCEQSSGVRYASTASDKLSNYPPRFLPSVEVITSDSWRFRADTFIDHLS